MKKTLVVLSLLTTFIINSIIVTGMDKKIFSDVEDDFWALESIDYLSSKRVINGFTDGSFKPNFNVQIDAFLKMTVTSLGYTDITNADDYWANNYIKKALELGLIEKDQFFDYTQPITREEMSSIIVKAIKDEQKADTRDYVESYVKDFSSISYKYKEEVKDAYSLGIITGLPSGEFQPQNYSTRAQASAIIHRMIDKNVRKPFVLKVPIENDVESGNMNDNDGNEITNENTDTDISDTTRLDDDTPIEDIHKVEDGKVVYSTEKIMKILKGYPLMPNSYSNDFEENNRICTDMQCERDYYDEASRNATEFIETLFTRNYKTLDKESYSTKLLYWLKAYMYYKEKDYEPKKFASVWVDETEMWKVQQDTIFVTHPCKMALTNSDSHEILRGRLYFRYTNHENTNNILYEMDLAINNLKFEKWYYVDVDVEMFRPMTNLPITWETSKYMLHSLHYLSDVKLVDGQ
ncbi:MAG: S-layer homology domain-containing protein [Vallitalea sp.]|jgi:hypothetical protein|nr:S-layer homology domain-containing protein [Vallitalea sp.]